jgi:hypothetical protein
LGIVASPFAVSISYDHDDAASLRTAPENLGREGFQTLDEWEIGRGMCLSTG